MCIHKCIYTYIHTKYNQCIYTNQTHIYINIYTCQIQKNQNKTIKRPIFKAKKGKIKLKKQYIGAKIESKTCDELNSLHSGVKGGSVEHLVRQGLY